MAEEGGKLRYRSTYEHILMQLSYQKASEVLVRDKVKGFKEDA